MRIRYVHSMLERPEDAARVPMEDIPTEGVPSHILEIIERHEAFSESATFGGRGLGDPEEYEKLVISTGSSCKTFEYFNKGVHFMSTGSEKDRPIFQVFAHFMMQSRATPG